MDYFEVRYGGDKIFEAQWFLDAFVEHGYLEPELMYKWREERRSLLNRMLCIDSPDDYFLKFIAHHATMIFKLDEVFHNRPENPHQGLFKEFCNLVPWLVSHYFRKVRWDESHEILIYKISLTFTTPYIFKLYAEGFDIPSLRIQKEVTMIIRFNKAIAESLRLKNFQILQECWENIKDMGRGRTVYRTMCILLPMDQPNYMNLARTVFLRSEAYTTF